MKKKKREKREGKKDYKKDDEMTQEQPRTKINEKTEAGTKTQNPKPKKNK